MNEELLALSWTGLHITPWKLIGYGGALLFGARWVVQLWATRRAGFPVIPRIFWIMSVTGSAMTLAYFGFSAKQDSVGVLQNLFPMFAASYNLWLDTRGNGWRSALAVGSKRNAPVSSPVGSGDDTLVVAERRQQCSSV